MEEHNDIIGITRIWCEGAQNEVSTAKRQRPRDRDLLVDLAGG